VEPARRPATLAGVLYLVTHVTSVGAVLLYGPMLTDPAWSGAGTSARPQQLGALLDVVLALAVVGTAVVLHPLLRTVAERGATAYVALRTLEAGAIVLGASAVVALVGVRGDAGAGAAAAGDALLGLYEAAFLVMGLVVPVHTVVLALLLRRHRLVAAWVPLVGLVGAVVVGASNVATLLGLQDQVSAAATLAALPVFAWEVALAVTLLVRGLRLPVARSGPMVAAVG
jgi:hypothetical protein